MSWLANAVRRTFTIPPVKEVYTLQYEHMIDASKPVWEIKEGATGDGWEPLPDEYKDRFTLTGKFPYGMFRKHFVGTIPVGTPYGLMRTTDGKEHQVLILTDGRRLLADNNMAGGRRKKRRTMRRKNKARRQSRKFR